MEIPCGRICFSPTMPNVRFPPIPDIAAATGNMSERLLKDSIRLDWPVRHAAGLVGPILRSVVAA